MQCHYSVYCAIVLLCYCAIVLLLGFSVTPPRLRHLNGSFYESHMRSLIFNFYGRGKVMSCFGRNALEVCMHT